MRTQAVVRCIIIKGDSIVLCRNTIRDFYSLPGGGLELGETINQGIVRELGEEMGLTPEQIHIHDDSFFAYEHTVVADGEEFYGIDLLKRVDMDSDVVENVLDYDAIKFELVKFSDLPNLRIPLYPEPARNYLLEKFCKK